MSLHFSYDFKDDLVKKLKEHYQEEVDLLQQERFEQEQLAEARSQIEAYFKEVLEDLGDVVEASGGDIKFEQNDEVIAKLIMFENYLKFTAKERSIEVKIGYYVPEADLVESIVLSYIVPGEKKCKIKRVGKIHDGSSFDQSSINYYMREAFYKIEF